MKQSDDNHLIPMTSIHSGKTRTVNVDLAYYTNQIVNIIFIGVPEGKWVMVDAGMPLSGSAIVAAAEKRYGAGSKPEAILLTHGHFDHVGSIVYLLEQWPGTPVYAHEYEMPFLNGQKSYPEPDPTVEGGLLAKISKLYPIGATDITAALHKLPADGTISLLPGWRWIHTPGHTPGHVSFFRERDKALIAGDAFVTVRQDAFFKVLLQTEEVNGPPPYLTTDWRSAKESVQKLFNLEPELSITGHGTHMEGKELRDGLELLAKDFDEIALPKFGKYVPSPDGEN